MKKAILALVMATLPDRAFPQDAAEKAETESAVAQFKAMQQVLDEQRKQIEQLASCAFPQDAAVKAETESAIAQFNAMQGILEEQRKQIKQLTLDAEKEEAELRKMRQQLLEKSGQSQPAAAQAEQPAAYPASLSRSIAPALAPQNEKGQATYQAAAPNAFSEGIPPIILRVNDTVYFRFGLLLQPTLDLTQDPNSQGYSQNFYLRRARFLMLGYLGSALQTFFQTDDPRVGNAGVTGAKNINTGFTVIDALVQWAFAGDSARLMAGLFLVPNVRQQLTFASHLLSLDTATWCLQEGAPLTENAGRDYGIGINGYLLDGRLNYRTGIFSGNRLGTTPEEPPLGPAAGSRNAIRVAGRAMYDFFDRERTYLGYAYYGTFLGQRKILAVGVVGDGQGDYRAYGGDIFFDWPVGKGDGVTFETDYKHYDGHVRYAATLPEQETLFTNAGYFFAAAKVQPFFRFETLDYASPANQAKETERVGGGLNYYVLWENFKITAAYERIIPKLQPTTAAIKDTNRFVLQFQGYAF